ncbi:V-snare-domain-containing protein [Atractiella rhizophila]|nr:V-snare-domain-containing protein [Atractiella rhizophila]
MDDLRRQVRTLENDLSTLLTTYSKLAAQVSTTYSSSGILNKDVKGEYKSVEKELEEGLGKLASFVEQMQSLLNNSNPPASSSQVLTVQRHREIHQDYVRDFKRTQTSLKEAEARANLLGSVREEISAFKSSSASDMLLNERSRIDSSDRLMDDVLNQAYETRAEFSRQRTHLSGVNMRMGGVLAQIPGLNSLLGMISSRRRRDTVILGCVTGVCCVLFFYAMTR